MTAITNPKPNDVAFSGSEWGVVRQTPSPAEIRFRRIATDGTLVGSETTITTSALRPSIAWVSTDYRVVYFQSDAIRLASIALDGIPSGAGDLASSVPRSSAFTGIATNGTELGVCYDDGAATWFTARSLADGRSFGPAVRISDGFVGCDVAVRGSTWGVAAITRDGGVAIARVTRCGR